MWAKPNTHIIKDIKQNIATNGVLNIDTFSGKMYLPHLIASLEVCYFSVLLG